MKGWATENKQRLKRLHWKQMFTRFSGHVVTTVLITCGDRLELKYQQVTLFNAQMKALWRGRDVKPSHISLPLLLHFLITSSACLCSVVLSALRVNNTPALSLRMRSVHLFVVQVFVPSIFFIQVLDNDDKPRVSHLLWRAGFPESGAFIVIISSFRSRFHQPLLSFRCFRQATRSYLLWSSRCESSSRIQLGPFTKLYQPHNSVNADAEDVHTSL